MNSILKLYKTLKIAETDWPTYTNAEEFAKTVKYSPRQNLNVSISDYSIFPDGFDDRKSPNKPLR